MIDSSVQRCCETFVVKYLKLREIEKFCTFFFGFFGSPSTRSAKHTRGTLFIRIKAATSMTAPKARLLFD